MTPKRLLVVVLFLLLVGCTPSSIPSATATPSRELDTSLATPVIGAVTVLPVPGKTSLGLYARPDVLAAVIAVAKPGDAGKLLGIDASGRWMLVEIKQKTGWAPAQYLDYTIAQ